MWDKLFTIASAVAAIVGAIVALVPTLIALFKSVKNRVNAKNEAEAEKARNDMREHLDALVVEIEDTYKDVNNILKQNGKSAGALKKQAVLTSLQQYAYDKGYLFDRDFWSEKIEEVVQLTRQVNAKV